MLPYVLINIGGKPLSFFGQRLHISYGFGAGTVNRVYINRPIPEFNTDVIVTNLVSNYTGIVICIFVGLHVIVFVVSTTKVLPFK